MREYGLFLGTPCDGTLIFSVFTLLIVWKEVPNNFDDQIQARLAAFGKLSFHPSERKK